jgi:hypothetical protein
LYCFSFFFQIIFLLGIHFATPYLCLLPSLLLPLNWNQFFIPSTAAPSSYWSQFWLLTYSDIILLSVLLLVFYIKWWTLAVLRLRVSSL